MTLKNSIPVWLRAPRNSLWIIVAAVLLVAIGYFSPKQLPVALYKVALISLAAVLGYWLDRALFPYARPDGYLKREWRLGTTEPDGDADYPVVPMYLRAFCAAQLRRAVVVAAVVLGIAMGL